MVVMRELGGLWRFGVGIHCWCTVDRGCLGRCVPRMLFESVCGCCSGEMSEIAVQCLLVILRSPSFPPLTQLSTLPPSLHSSTDGSEYHSHFI